MQQQKFTSTRRLQRPIRTQTWEIQASDHATNPSELTFNRRWFSNVSSAERPTWETTTAFDMYVFNESTNNHFWESHDSETEHKYFWSIYTVLLSSWNHLISWFYWYLWFWTPLWLIQSIRNHGMTVKFLKDFLLLFLLIISKWIIAWYIYFLSWFVRKWFIFWWVLILI